MEFEKSIGVDLDGTLAHYDGWKGARHIGEPNPMMSEKVRNWLKEGKKVKIFTARAYDDDEDISLEEKVALIQDWTEKHFGQRLDVTCEKDPGMEQIWDDKAFHVELNAAQRLEATKE